LNQNSDPLWLIVAGRDESEVARRLDEVKPLLTTAVSNREISGFTLADVLWPRPEFQSANRATAAALASMRDGLAGDAEASGFASNSMALTRGILDTWSQTAGVKGVFWPTNRTSQWIFQRLVGRKPGRLLSVGLIHPTPARSGAGRASMPTLVNGLPGENVWLSGWGLLGIAIFQDVTGNLWKLVVPMIALVLLSLALAFRRRTEVLLSLAVLALSGLCLLTSMRLAGWSWNLLNLMALPLILGTGVDYTIFMQLALRRHRGDLALAHRSVGRALLLCGATAVAGFGSLAWSGNAGMASLGQVCAVGIGCNMLIAVFLLPTWWSVCTKG
jgi:predicted exporter